MHIAPDARGGGCGVFVVHHVGSLIEHFEHVTCRCHCSCLSSLRFPELQPALASLDHRLLCYNAARCHQLHCRPMAAAYTVSSCGKAQQTARSCAVMSRSWRLMTANLFASFQAVRMLSMQPRCHVTMVAGCVHVSDGRNTQLQPIACSSSQRT